MIPLDLRFIDDEAVEDTISLAMHYAIREESYNFCVKFDKYLKSWEGYCALRSDLERIFQNHRNLQRVIYNVAVRHYIDFCYTSAILDTNQTMGC